MPGVPDLSKVPLPGVPDQLGVPDLQGGDAARSAHVLRRFALRIVLLTFWAGLLALFGHHGFGRSFVCMVLMSAFLSQLAALWRREKVRAPHWTSFDEASWLLLLGFALQRYLP